MEGCEAYRLVEMSEMAVGHAQQLVGSGLHDATAHVTTAYVNAMHTKVLAQVGKRHQNAKL